MEINSGQYEVAFLGTLKIRQCSELVTLSCMAVVHNKGPLGEWLEQHRVNKYGAKKLSAYTIDELARILTDCFEAIGKHMQRPISLYDRVKRVPWFRYQIWRWTTAPHLRLACTAVEESLSKVIDEQFVNLSAIFLFHQSEFTQATKNVNLIDRCLATKEPGMGAPEKVEVHCIIDPHTGAIEQISLNRALRAAHSETDRRFYGLFCVSAERPFDQPRAGWSVFSPLWRIAETELKPKLSDQASSVLKLSRFMTVRALEKSWLKADLVTWAALRSAQSYYIYDHHCRAARLKQFGCNVGWPKPQTTTGDSGELSPAGLADLSNFLGAIADRLLESYSETAPCDTLSPHGELQLVFVADRRGIETQRTDTEEEMANAND
jgi:hypothetical protein